MAQVAPALPHWGNVRSATEDRTEVVLRPSRHDPFPEYSLQGKIFKKNLSTNSRKASGAYERYQSTKNTTIMTLLQNMILRIINS